MSAQPNPQKVAIFDIDGTVFRTGVMFEVVDRMIEEGVLPRETSAEMIEAKNAWKNRHGKFELFDKHFVQFVQREFAGLDVKKFEALAAEVIGEVKDHQYRYTRGLMEQFRNRGYVLMAISGAHQIVLDIYNRYLGFDTVYASKLEVKDGKFTGEYDFSSYDDKASIVKQFLKEHPAITLDESYGVGDTASDVGFLELVTYPIAFNPNRELFEIATKHSWEIVVERKDVIYHIAEPGTDEHLRVE